MNTKNRLCTIVCRGGLFIRGSDLFIKIEEGLILAGAVHTGGEHPVGGVVFLIAFGDDVGEVEPVERPVGDGGERLRAVAVAREVRRDTAAELVSGAVRTACGSAKPESAPSSRTVKFTARERA